MGRGNEREEGGKEKNKKFIERVSQIKVRTQIQQQGLKRFSLNKLKQI